MRVAILGAGGQLGRDLIDVCGLRGDEVHGFTREQVDITDHTVVRDALHAARPDVVVNCAAWTDVDGCELDPERAMAVNGTAVGALGETVSTLQAHLVHVSTDFVFDGSKPSLYVEDDITGPINAYGQSKLAGEASVSETATIVRTSWVYSRHPRNVVATLCHLMGAHPTVSFVTDRVGTPTDSRDLAVALRQFAEERFVGLVHCANGPPTSWYEFAQSVFAAAGEHPDRVLPILAADLKGESARRPAQSGLDTRRFTSLHGELPDFRERLAEIVAAHRTS